MRVLSVFLLVCVGCNPDAEIDPPDTGGIEAVAPWGDQDPFADALVHFEPGENAGFGQDELPGIVLGPPLGMGPNAGGLDVVSLGDGGEIVLEMTDILILDGPGPDLLVFENPFPGWQELGQVAVSDDGETWHAWPCDPEDPTGADSQCAGLESVLAHPENDLDPTAPDLAGGDAFDLADFDLTVARFVRITDTGTNDSQGTSAGFDLDAIAAVHWHDQ